MTMTKAEKQKAQLSHRKNSCANIVIYFFTAQVLIPKGAYKGQKLMKLVRTNTADKPINTIPNVPEMMFVK